MMTLMWRWPWAGPAALVLAVIAVVVALILAGRKSAPADSPRVFTLDSDLNTESGGRQFRQWRLLHRVALTLLLVAEHGAALTSCTCQRSR